ncbi:MAG: DUF4920 domain-containing protein [Bacteroidetes bacterium]|nr:DUF4920 domain-containing protein [Bacteroidota bacterium]
MKLTRNSLAFLILSICSSLTLSACNSGSTASADAENQEAPVDSLHGEEASNVVLNSAGGYGIVISADQATPCGALVSALENSGEISAKVQGKVTAACQVSGCWMKMDCGSGEPMRVTFKDYGFFVPKDLAGKEVIVQGVAVKKEVSVETLRHFAQDEGKSEAEIAAITQPAWEYEFIADGVLPVQ